MTSPHQYNLDPNALDHTWMCVLGPGGCSGMQKWGRKVRRGNSRISRLWGTTSLFPYAQLQCAWCYTALVPLQYAKVCPDQQSTLKKKTMAMNGLVAFTLYLMATEILRMPLHVPDGVGEMPFHTAKRCCCPRF